VTTEKFSGRLKSLNSSETCVGKRLTVYFRINEIIFNSSTKYETFCCR